MIPRPWRFALATAAGPMHEREGSPCQDRVACQTTSDANGEAVLLAVVSDGAGSAERAEVGSDLACATLMDISSDFIKMGKVEEIDANVAISWFETVRQVLAERAQADGEAVRDYACTLLAAFVGRNSAAFMQVRDGAIVTSGTSDHEWAWVFWPQHGEFANSTFFVTDENVGQRADFKTFTHRIDDIAIFTDGIENLVLHCATQTVYEPFFTQMFLPVWASGASGSDMELSRALAVYLSSTSMCERSDDDKALILASRRSH